MLLCCVTWFRGAGEYYAKELGCANLKRSPFTLTTEIITGNELWDWIQALSSCNDRTVLTRPRRKRSFDFKKVVDYAHQLDVTVEGGIGVLPVWKMKFSWIII